MRRTALTSLLLFACTDASPCPQGDLCHAPRTIPLSTVPLNARHIDLDGDAHLDLVGVGNGAFILRRGASDGTLAAPELLAVPGSNTALVTGDFDGDGRPDALTAIPSLPALAWLRHTDDLRVLPIAAAYSPLAVADLDRDGDDDVIAATPHSLHVLLGGEHGPNEQSRLELDDRGAIAIGDLAGDGGLDLAVVRPLRGAVDRFTITDSGAITRVGTLWRTEFPTAVIFADLDDDGALDLAAADRLARVVRISLGDGDGAFLRHTDFNVDLEPVALAARRGPHGRELAVTGADLDTLQLLDPMTGALRISAFITSTPAPDAVDLDGDGVDELVRGESRLDEIPGFAATRTWTAAPGRETGRITLADLDGDGARELVALDPHRAELIVHNSDGLELSRTPAPPALEGLRALDGVDGPAIAWWSLTDLSVRTGDTTTTTSFAPRTILDVVADPLNIYVATTAPPKGATVWRLHRKQDGSLSTSEPVFTGPAITSLTLATPGDPWISHAAGVSRLPNRTVSPLRDLTGATLVDLDDDTPALVGCRDDGLFVARDGAPSERLADTPCTRVDACDLDDDGVLELLVTRGREASPLSPGYTGLEVLSRDGDTWTRRGAFTLGLQADHLALACDDLTVWTGGPLGLARADLHPGPALRETSVRLPVRSPLLGDLDGDGRDELLADDGRHLLLARTTDDLPRLLPATTATPVALAELDGTPGREVLARTTDLDGVTTHAIWSLRGDIFVRTGALAEPDLELTILDLFADFDGDGRDELLTRNGDVLRILRVDARGATTLLASDPISTPNLLRAADMDRDGRADLLLPVFEAGFPIDVRLSRGDGSFAPPHRWPLGLDSFGGNGLAVGDLDGNGTHDLVYVDTRGAAILICPGNGHGGPAAPCRRIAWDPGDSSVAQPVVGDFDGDGAPDLVISASNGPTLHLLRGDGAGRLVMAPKIPLSTAGTLRRASADIGALWLQLAPGRAVVLTAEPR